MLARTEAALVAEADDDHPIGREATHGGHAELLIALAVNSRGPATSLGDQLAEAAAEGTIERGSSGPREPPVAAALDPFFASRDDAGDAGESAQTPTTTRSAGTSWERTSAERNFEGHSRPAFMPERLSPSQQMKLCRARFTQGLCSAAVPSPVSASCRLTVAVIFAGLTLSVMLALTGVRRAASGPRRGERGSTSPPTTSRCSAAGRARTRCSRSRSWKNLLTVAATFESYDFRWAYVIRYSEDYRLTIEERRALMQKTLDESKEVHQFYVALYGANWRWTDLSRANSAWTVRLIDSSGDETGAGEDRAHSQARRRSSGPTSRTPRCGGRRSASAFPRRRWGGRRSPTMPSGSASALPGVEGGQRGAALVDRTREQRREAHGAADPGRPRTASRRSSPGRAGRRRHRRLHHPGEQLQ